MAKKQYFDKKGNEIVAGMTVRFDDGSEEKIHECGDGKLGILATNPDFLKNHPDFPEEYYPLTEYYVNCEII